MAIKKHFVILFSVVLLSTFSASAAQEYTKRSYSQVPQYFEKIGLDDDLMNQFNGDSITTAIISPLAVDEGNLRILNGQVDGETGIAPGVEIIPYIGKLDRYSPVIQNAIQVDQARIVAIYVNNYNIGHLAQYKQDWFQNAAVVVRAGDHYSDNRVQAIRRAVPAPRFNNLIITVGVNEKGELNPTSRSCGFARTFCVAIPASGYTTPTPSAVAGALALLMQAEPEIKDPAVFVQALLSTASNSQNPSEETGVGIIHVGRALEALLAEKQKNLSKPGFFRSIYDRFFLWH